MVDEPNETFRDSRVPLDDAKLYTLSTKPYLMHGGDGYTAFANHERIIISEDIGMPSFALIRNYFVMKANFMLPVRSDTHVREILPLDKTITIVTSIEPKVEGRILTLEQYRTLCPNEL